MTMCVLTTLAAIAQGSAPEPLPVARQGQWEVRTGSRNNFIMGPGGLTRIRDTGGRPIRSICSGGGHRPPKARSGCVVTDYAVRSPHVSWVETCAHGARSFETRVSATAGTLHTSGVRQVTIRENGIITATSEEYQEARWVAPCAPPPS